jgi:hypothetical protein
VEQQHHEQLTIHEPVNSQHQERDHVHRVDIVETERIQKEISHKEDIQRLNS